MMTNIAYYIAFSLVDPLYNNFPKSENFQTKEEGQSLDLHSHLTWIKVANYHYYFLAY